MKGSVPPALPRGGIFNHPKSIYLWRKPGAALDWKTGGWRAEIQASAHCYT